MGETSIKSETRTGKEIGRSYHIPSYMGTKVAFNEYVAAAIVAHSCLLLDMMPTFE